MAVVLSGVTEYAYGHYLFTASFPNRELKCRHCDMCQTDDSMRKRDICILTHEILYDVNTIGARCPLTFTEGNDDGAEIPTTEG